MYSDEYQMLKVSEAAKFLRCSRTKLMEYIHSGVIDAYMVAGKWLILREDLVEFVVRS